MTDSKLPHVIVHDSISADGSFLGFDYTQEMMRLHYSLASKIDGGGLRLMGSVTCETSIALFGGFTSETRADFARPAKRPGAARWLIPDSGARLEGKLHYFRRSEYCADVVALISEKTPQSYVEYLKARNYDYFVTGAEKVDLRRALELAAEKYAVKTVLADSGRGLVNALLNDNLVAELSLLVQPQLIGAQAQNLFSGVAAARKLELLGCEAFPGGYVWLRYKITR